MIVLVAGGARSGKSKFAEDFFKEKETVYIATSKVFDREMEDRVKEHKKDRPSNFRTVESYKNLGEIISSEENYLLDCVTNMLSNIMYEETKDLDFIDKKKEKEVEKIVKDELDRLLDLIREKSYNLVLVTNELGYSPVPEHHITRVFRDIQGRVNQYLAGVAQEVYMVCLGIPLRIK